MTGALPHWRVVSHDAGITRIVWIDDDFSEVAMVVRSSVIGTAELDRLIRRSYAVRHAAHDAVRGEGA